MSFSQTLNGQVEQARDSVEKVRSRVFLLFYAHFMRILRSLLLNLRGQAKDAYRKQCNALEAVYAKYEKADGQVGQQVRFIFTLHIL